MDHARSTLTIVALAGLTLAGAIVGPKLGSPDPAVMMVILFSSLTSSIAGFAFSAICGGILFHLWDDHIRVVQIMIACSVANQAAMVWSLRATVPWRSVAVFVAGGMGGAPLGAWTLLHLDHARFGQAIGGFLLVYGTFLAFARTRPIRLDNRWADAIIGCSGGMAGAAAALPSLPLTIWCQLRGLDKETQRAVVQPFILAMQLVSFGLIALLNPQHAAGLSLADLCCIPAGLFGTQVGMGCYRGLSERQFAVAVSALMIVCGLSFVL
jgi:uncharacterized membrane protein YfcA